MYVCKVLVFSNIHVYMSIVEDSFKKNIYISLLLTKIVSLLISHCRHRNNCLTYGLSLVEYFPSKLFFPCDRQLSVLREASFINVTHGLLGHHADV